VAGKQYVVLRDHRRVDKNGDSTSYKKDDPYTGPVSDEDVHPQGPDGRGPLLGDKPSPASSASSDSSSKEKS
jgi:hypothetical protein